MRNTPLSGRTSLSSAPEPASDAKAFDGVAGKLQYFHQYAGDGDWLLRIEILATRDTAACDGYLQWRRLEDYFWQADLANRVDAPCALPMLRQLIRLPRRAHQANRRDV